MLAENQTWVFSRCKYDKLEITPKGNGLRNKIAILKQVKNYISMFALRFRTLSEWFQCPIVSFSSSWITFAEKLADIVPLAPPVLCRHGKSNHFHSPVWKLMPCPFLLLSLKFIHYISSHRTTFRCAIIPVSARTTLSVGPICKTQQQHSSCYWSRYWQRMIASHFARRPFHYVSL